MRWSASTHGSLQTTFRRCAALITVSLLGSVIGAAQPAFPGQDRLSTWLPYQAIPNLLLYSGTDVSAFGLEWDATPVLYSFGMNPKISPWYSFIVTPTARFTGSIELVVTGVTFARKVGGSYFGYSGQLLGHLPLSDMGELFGLNLGVAAYGTGDTFRLYEVAGFSTAFGMLHLNVKHADRPTTWMTSLEVRIY